MPALDAALDHLRGRLWRLSRQGKRLPMIMLARTIDVSLPTLMAFIDDSANPTLETLRKIESWCERQERERHHA